MQGNFSKPQTTEVPQKGYECCRSFYEITMTTRACRMQHWTTKDACFLTCKHSAPHPSYTEQGSASWPALDSAGIQRSRDLGVWGYPSAILDGNQASMD